MPKQDCVQKLKDKLVEAAAVYKKDRETLDWYVMQDPKVRRIRLTAKYKVSLNAHSCDSF
jgi:hypothetical protein